MTREAFDQICDVVWTEMVYQPGNRIGDEAIDVPGFATLLRRHLRKVEDSWADGMGELQEDESVQVPEALHGLRKIAAIAIRAMYFNGVRSRNVSQGESK